jgi:hypothetical protein
MALLEYLLFRYNKTVQAVINAPQVKPHLHLHTQQQTG